MGYIWQFFIALVFVVGIFIFFSCSPRNTLPKVNINDLQPLASSKWKNECLCRQILEKIFALPFPSQRPDFLKNPQTNRNLELDCYNSSLKLALEYNGKQHYKFPNKFHNSVEAFNAQIARDELKKTLCDNHGVTLIIVPYTIPKSQIVDYIVAKLEMAHFIQK